MENRMVIRFFFFLNSQVYFCSVLVLTLKRPFRAECTSSTPQNIPIILLLLWIEDQTALVLDSRIVKSRSKQRYKQAPWSPSSRGASEFKSRFHFFFVFRLFFIPVSRFFFVFFFIREIINPTKSLFFRFIYIYIYVCVSLCDLCFGLQCNVCYAGRTASATRVQAVGRGFVVRNRNVKMAAIGTLQVCKLW